jgi:hypothetical protein
MASKRDLFPIFGKTILFGTAATVKKINQHCNFTVLLQLVTHRVGSAGPIATSQVPEILRVSLKVTEVSVSEGLSNFLEWGGGTSPPLHLLLLQTSVTTVTTIRKYGNNSHLGRDMAIVGLVSFGVTNAPSASLIPVGL